MTKPYLTAVIDESLCIGCARCLPACPVDAIIGSNQHMHTVITTECIACGLCIPPCPMDCIQLISVNNLLYSKEKAKQRAKARKLRLDTQKTKENPIIPSIDEREAEIRRLKQEF